MLRFRKKAATTPIPKIAWEVPAYLPYVQPPLTDATLREAERTLGLRLPDTYIAALREQNGGYLRFGWRGFAGRDLWGIGPRFPSILRGSIAKRFERVDDVWLPRKADKLIPFVGDGHWYLCFDARASRDAPAIALVDLESEKHRVVAPSFSQFLSDALGTSDQEPRVGLVTDVGLELAARYLGDALDMTITNQGAWADGYETFHGRSKSGASHSQFWISPNEVPRGFVREDDDEHDNLVGLLPGTALRHPEHPDCTMIIEVTDLSIDDLLAACARSRLSAQRL